jgi:hypothetical protein
MEKAEKEKALAKESSKLEKKSTNNFLNNGGLPDGPNASLGADNSGKSLIPIVASGKKEEEKNP